MRREARHGLQSHATGRNDVDLHGQEAHATGCYGTSYIDRSRRKLKESRSRIADIVPQTETRETGAGLRNEAE